VSITVTLRCKPYVKHYLVSRFGNPVKLPRKSQTKKLFLACIKKNFEPSRSQFIAQLPASLEIQLSKHDLSQHGHTIDSGMLFFINGIFEEKIKNEMFFEVTLLRSEKKMTLKNAIAVYQQQHGFTNENFPVEAIQAAYYRCMPENKFSPKLQINNPPC